MKCVEDEDEDEGRVKTCMRNKISKRAAVSLSDIAAARLTDMTRDWRRKGGQPRRIRYEEIGMRMSRESSKLLVDKLQRILNCMCGSSDLRWRPSRSRYSTTTRQTPLAASKRADYV